MCVLCSLKIFRKACAFVLRVSFVVTPFKISSVAYFFDHARWHVGSELPDKGSKACAPCTGRPVPPAREGRLNRWTDREVFTSVFVSDSGAWLVGIIPLL